MADVHVPDWSPEQVVHWIRGLDDVLLPYTHNFLNNGITGRHLVCFAVDDLPHLGVTKLGHQELILEAVELLKQFYHNLESENLQWLSLRLACKARGLFKELSYQEAANQAALTSGSRCQDRVSTKTLSTVVDVINSVKAVVTWLDRSPFDGQEFYVNLRNDLLKSSIILATNAQRDSFAEEPNVVIKNICFKMSEQFDCLTKSNNDSLFIQPTHLEIAVVKKKPNEELGMHIQSLFSGIHVIGGVRFQSPADSCGRGRIEIGDEIVQVNYQTVIGWHQKNLVALMKANPTEVILTLKKRPVHSNTFGQAVPHKLFFPVKKPTAYLAKHEWDPSASAPVTISITDVNNQTSSVPNLNTSNASEAQKGPEKPPEVAPQPASQRAVPETTAETTEDDDDDSAFLPEEVTKSQMSGELLHLATPRVQVTLQRRCTVSGGSPTAQRPPVSIDQLWNGMKREQVMRSLSHDVTRAEWRWRMSEFTPRQLDTIASSLAPLVPPAVPESSTVPEEPESKPGTQDTIDTVQEDSSPAAMEITESVTASEKPIHFSQKTINVGEYRQMPQIQSYQVVIVGGVAQVAPMSKDPKKLPSESPVLRHKSKSLQRAGSGSRRVSCKDLGEGDCEGWLFTGHAAQGSLAGFKWAKTWCVLKGRFFYVFRDRNSVKAECFICLPAFQVSPAPECKSKKFGFKVYNSGANFYFASDTQLDMSKWMNKMGLAAIEYEGSKAIPNFEQKSSRKTVSESDEYFSETDQSDDSSCDSHDYHRPLGSPLQKSATVNTVSEVCTVSTTELGASQTRWGGSLPRLNSHRKAYVDDSQLFARPQPPAKVRSPSNITRLTVSTGKKCGQSQSQLEEYRVKTLPVGFSRRRWAGMIKSGSLEWKNAGNPVPATTGEHPAVEPNAKMALAFEMNLDSSSPPRESASGDENSTLKKSSLRLFGSPKFVKKSVKVKQFGSSVWFDEGVGVKNMPVVEVPRAPTKKPAMGVSMIGKQRRTSSQSSGEGASRPHTQGATITQATQTDEARLNLHDDGDFGMWVDDEGKSYGNMAAAVNEMHVGRQMGSSTYARNSRKRRLKELKKFLRAKCQELDAIDAVLREPVESSSLREFAAQYPQCP